MPTVTGPTPLTVNFTDQSTGDNLTYYWEFGGEEETSTQASPTHIYNQVGTFNVKLTVNNSDGEDMKEYPAAVIATSTGEGGYYTLSLNAPYVYGESPGAVGQGGTSPYSAGTVVAIVASPFDTFGFMNWSGDTDGIENITAADTHVTMNGNYTIAAVFEYEGN